MSEFATRKLHFAIFLRASGVLPFLRIEHHVSGQYSFVFEDKDGLGKQFEREFENGTARAIARDLFLEQTTLRKLISAFEKTGADRNGYEPRS